jgi:hypothetical protein
MIFLQTAVIAALGLSALTPVFAVNPGFPYGSQKVRGVNLGGWLVLEVNFSFFLSCHFQSSLVFLSHGSRLLYSITRAIRVLSTNGRLVSIKTTTRP